MLLSRIICISLLCMLFVAAGACASAPTPANQQFAASAPEPSTPTPEPSTPTSEPSTPIPEPPSPSAVPPSPTPAGPLAPDVFDQAGPWINSEPLTLADLRGRVVLVNFWTYGCYNCQNTLPYVRQWWDTYQDEGLVIIGVHTPELNWEYPLENVQQAVQNEGIGWPVVQDNDKTIWRAYNNRFWPRFYLVDHTGHIIYDRIGEGGYDITEQQIVAALHAAQNAE